jgi:hypothetical protein
MWASRAVRPPSGGGWFVAVAVAVALVAPVLGVVAGAVAGWGGEVASQHRPADGVLVDQVVAGGVGVAVEVAGDGVEQDAAVVDQRFTRYHDWVAAATRS